MMGRGAAFLVLACLALVWLSAGSGSVFAAEGRRDGVAAAAEHHGSAAGGADQAQIIRAAFVVKGLVAPRAVGNVFTRLLKTPGVRAIRCDLGLNRIIVDFRPGVSVSREQVRRIVNSSGWAPGTVRIQQLPLHKANDQGPQWIVVPEFTGSSLIRWLKLSFTPWAHFWEWKPAPADDPEDLGVGQRAPQ